MVGHTHEDKDPKFSRMKKQNEKKKQAFMGIIHSWEFVPTKRNSK